MNATLDFTQNPSGQAEHAHQECIVSEANTFDEGVAGCLFKSLLQTGAFFSQFIYGVRALRVNPSFGLCVDILVLFADMSERFCMQMKGVGNFLQHVPPLF